MSKYPLTRVEIYALLDNYTLRSKLITLSIKN
jgi:hypothetical protein